MNYPNTQLLINGKWRDSGDGQSIPIVNPSTGLEIGRVSCATKSDLDEALSAAQIGFDIWRKIPAIERSRLMELASKNLRERLEDIAMLITLEQGKPLAEARGEVMMAIEVIDWFAGEARRVYGRVIPARNLCIDQRALKFPVGPVAAFTPWNFPVNQIARKLAAALSCGCSIIIKAPEETPASPAALIQAFIDAGIPNGVVGLVYGNPAEISEYLIAHPIIRKITFTGSTPVGKQLASLAGKYMKRCTMELGGHAPVIVADDADIKLAVKSAGAAKFRNAGQVCISPTRFLVHDSRKDEFIKETLSYIENLRVGNGLDDQVNMGPLANGRRLNAMAELTSDALKKGANIITGGKKIGDIGNFFQPTLLDNVSLDAKLFNEEPFGPILGIKTFKHIDEAINEANRLDFGLAGYAFTSSIKNSHKLSQELEVGMLWINQQATAWPEMPFGGIKDSGYGSEGGYEAMEAYLNTKSVSIFAG
ncbi:NAD-dependent succinate-semialdehyde dehydrogenase [Polynucleobacter aenigmaticus]|uniref:NAD-dependent succinate-semialdehyde dehydrogenase n=1 Tax=Polynucleobacter aenigmaticus TaxID=1743164 RepID=A0A254QA75_9BURK|nr:NAD-dependent succinate-semialdehyde dehydrogenase [Polynucleobacter aenigmaticus]OWS71807.1 NAD-dependent succinate-semialdehyde dehydrogenase [Polynucleobacter aenigmaticus]